MIRDFNVLVMAEWPIALGISVSSSNRNQYVI